MQLQVEEQKQQEQSLIAKKEELNIANEGLKRDIQVSSFISFAHCAKGSVEPFCVLPLGSLKTNWAPCKKLGQG